MSSIIRESLGARAASTNRSLAISGKIRPGTKAISKTAASNPIAVALFRKAQAGVTTFKDAEREIGEKTGIKFPFYPRNTQHFNVYAHDVEGGQHTIDAIMGMYGEKREGDSEPRLYAFPIFFPDTGKAIEGVFPSEFRVAQGPIKYHSSYGDDGMRRCLYLKPVEPKEYVKRRKYERRTEAVRGECVPGACPEFAAGTCRFGGTLHFYIHNVPGSGTFAMQTGSTYAAEDIFQRLDEILRICNGRLPQLSASGEPIFHLTKVKRMRTYFDEEGCEKKGEQWVPFLETTLNMSAVIRQQQSRQNLLSGPAAEPPIARMPEGWIAAPVSPNPQREPGGEPSVVANCDPVALKLDADERPKRTGSQFADAMNEGGESAANQFLNVARENNLGQIAQEWASAKFGDDWRSAEKAPSALAELRSLLQVRGVDCCSKFMMLCTLLYRNAIPVREVALPYLVLSYGKGLTRDSRLLASAHRHVAELLEVSGCDGALTHMSRRGESVS